MLIQLENYIWRYTSASQLVNTILNYIDPRAPGLFSRQEYLNLSESMLQTILTRQNLNLSETRKFQVMLQWALHKVRRATQERAHHHHHANKPDNNVRSHEKVNYSKVNELQAIMNRLTRDLKLHKIPPQDLIKVSLPCDVRMSQLGNESEKRKLCKKREMCVAGMRFSLFTICQHASHVGRQKSVYSVSELSYLCLKRFGLLSCRFAISF